MGNKTEIKHVICTFCANNCGVLAHVENGNVIKIEGNKEHPSSRGFFCERCQLAVKWLYHPEQLKYPQKRIGARGENKWQRITWDQALDEIADKLDTLKQRYGPETLAVTEGTLRGTQFWERSRFGYLFGNPHNVTHPGNTCQINRYAMSQTMAGQKVVNKETSSYDLVKRVNCVVFWGSNQSESGPRGAAILRQERKNRTIRTIVIDPRITRDAEEADIHLQLRPGTDAALGLAWINVIINEQLYDKEFVSQWTTGFEKLVQRVQEYPPQRVAEITGLTVEEIIESARLYANSRPAALLGGLATDQIGLNGIRAAQVHDICAALTGNAVVPQTGIGPYNENGRFIRSSELELRASLPQEAKRKQLGSDRFKLMTWEGFDLIAREYEKHKRVPAPSIHTMGISPSLLWRTILSRKPYPITAMISWDSNPLAWAANTRMVYDAMKSPNLELYVVNEYWMTPTALMADYVLPIASWLERAYVDTLEDNANFALVGEKAVEPLGERKDDYHFWRGLGIRLGKKDYWPWETMEELIAYRVKPMGLTYEEAAKIGLLTTPSGPQKEEKYCFGTPSGKFEFYPSILEKLGYDPLPFYEEPAESPVRTPEVAKSYPFILITGGRFMPQFHSEFRHWGIGAREKNPDPLADINLQDAQNLGIQDGDWIYIETRRGRIKQKARVSSKIKPGVVNVQASWWFPEMPAEEPSLHGLWESNANVLTLDDPDTCDPLTGGWQSRALLCKVYKA